MKDVVEHQSPLNVHVTEEIETEDPDQDHDLVQDHEIDVADPDEANDHHMLAKNWSIIDCRYLPHFDLETFFFYIETNDILWMRNFRYKL